MGKDSFKQIEEEVDSDPIKKSVSKMTPGVAKVSSFFLPFGSVFLSLAASAGCILAKVPIFFGVFFWVNSGTYLR